MSYYSDKLAAERLKKCYEIAPPRVQQYLEAEIDFVCSHIKPEHTVLDLGCGYGRTLPPMAKIAEHVTGIDHSKSSIEMGMNSLKDYDNIELLCMDASKLAFNDNQFDIVVCIQNGISAFHVEPLMLIKESLRVAKEKGKVLFSTYSENFWNERIKWFKLQSDAGLLGEIDWEKTGDGNIVCYDGFTATTFSEAQFNKLARQTGLKASFIEVDNSSLFCIFNK